MIRLIVGKKGSGKTKRLIEEINAAEREEHGHIVCIEKSAKLTYDLKPNVKLIDSDDYGINGYDQLYAFIAGTNAANYDTTKIFVDNCMKIGGKDFGELAAFIERLGALSEDTLTQYTLTISADRADIPAELERFIV